MTTEKKNNNFTLNINYLLYISKSIFFSHTFVYHRSILYQMLLRFFKVESADMEMIMFFGFPFSFGFFLTQRFIGQYRSEREGRGYRCRCTSVPLSLYFISIL